MEQEPLMEIRSSPLGTGKPTKLKVFEDAIWVHQLNSPINLQRQRVLYGQIAQVWTERRIVFSTLVIETRGGDTLKVDGVTHGVAKTAAEFIEQRLRSGTPRAFPEGEGPLHTSSGTSQSDVYEQIRKLADLRDENLITPAEYEAKKRNLLDSL